MKRGSFWLVVLALMSGLSGLSARAAELSLFDVPLRDATPVALHAAALAAGARLVKSSAGHRVYDASRIALSGAHTLETLFEGEQLVVAAYSFKRGSTGDYELRRLLAAQYGPTYVLSTPMPAMTPGPASPMPTSRGAGALLKRRAAVPA
jgi:hypothetical protein